MTTSDPTPPAEPVPPTEARDSAGTMVREAVAVFHDVEALDRTVSDLRSAGFDRPDVSILASRETVRAKLGRDYGDIHELADDPDAPGTPPVSRYPVVFGQAAAVGVPAYLAFSLGAAVTVATGGTLGAVLAIGGASGGAGALLGGVLARWLGRKRASWLQDQLDRGGILLWVRVDDAERERRALSILKRTAQDEVRVHEWPIAA